MWIGAIGALDKTLYLLAGTACLVIITIALLRRAGYRRAATRDVTRAQRAYLREQREVQQSLEALLNQLEEVSRRIAADADTRIAKLQELVAAADARLAQSTPETAAGKSTSAAPPPDRQRIYEMADKGAAPVTIADSLHQPVGEVELILNLRKFAASNKRPEKSVNAA